MVADGWFHAAMYAVAAGGLWRLWRARGALGAPGAGRALLAWGLVGFGAWHVVDAVGSHWLLGIHRIRMDAASPLAWDLGWVGAFGVVPLVLGLWLRRGGGPGRPRAGAAALALATLGAAAWAAAPPPGRAFATVAFAPGVPPAAAFAAAAAAGEGVMWADEAAGVFVVAGVGPRSAAALYRQGALFVGGAGLPGGCRTWAREEVTVPPFVPSTRAAFQRISQSARFRDGQIIPAGLRGDLFDPGVAAKGPDAIGFGEEAHPGVASRASMMASVEWGRRSGRRRLRRWSQTRSTGLSSGLWGGRTTRVMPGGTTRSRPACQPAPSSTMTRCASAGRAAATWSRKSWHSRR